MNILKEITSYKEDIPELKDEILNFIKDNSSQQSRDSTKCHITGSAWIIDKKLESVLLTHHNKLDIWVQTGGHCENRETPFKAAWREGEEESGLRITPLKKELFHLDKHIIPKYLNTQEHIHYDFTYIFIANSGIDYVVSAESKDLKWVKLEDITAESYEKNILLMKEKTINLISSMPYIKKLEIKDGIQK